MKPPSLLWTGPPHSDVEFLMAHGAGAPMDSDWMNTMAELISLPGIRVGRFEFPYMQDRRSFGVRRPPNPEVILTETWKNVIASRPRAMRIFIGGKSLGGRIASLVADQVNCQGLICFGYPFHAPGKPIEERLTRLQTLKTPGLIVQGERDPMGSRAEIEGLSLPATLQVHWLTDGDHSFNPRKSSGSTLAENLHEACAIAAEFML